MLDVKALLTKILLRLSSIGTIYENSLSTTISKTDVDQNTDGASITVPTGVYTVIGQWGFNTRSTSGTTNSAIRMYRSSDNYANNIAQTRIYGAGNNWNALQCSCIVNVTNATETIKICGATSRPYTTSTVTWIKAVRIV